MSYCVNCGVQLDKTAKRCPLCNTPVINPSEAIDTVSKTPYPQKRGRVEQVKNSDLAILLSVILGSSAVACGIINFFFFSKTLWSLYIIGACITIWVFFTPAILYTRLSAYASILFDGVVVGIYCFLISIPHPANGWFFDMAIPIIAMMIILSMIHLFLVRRISASILLVAIYIFTEIGVFILALEALIRNHLSLPFGFSWSAVVAICCVFIDILLITITARSRLREAVRRRMHI